MTLNRLALIVAFTALVAACGQAKPGAVDGKRMAAASSNGDWVSVGRTYDEQRYSPLTKIDTKNVGTLGLAVRGCSVW